MALPTTYIMTCLGVWVIYIYITLYTVALKNLIYYYIHLQTDQRLRCDGPKTPSQSSPSRVQHTSRDGSRFSLPPTVLRFLTTLTPPSEVARVATSFPHTGHLHHHHITTIFVRIIYLFHTKESCAFTTSDRVGSRGRGAYVMQYIILYTLYL